jgi:hypothetical protein
MDVHGTKLARTLCTIATRVERGAAKQRDGAASSSQTLDASRTVEFGPLYIVRLRILRQHCRIRQTNGSERD